MNDWNCGKKKTLWYGILTYVILDVLLEADSGFSGFAEFVTSFLSVICVSMTLAGGFGLTDALLFAGG